MYIYIHRRLPLRLIPNSIVQYIVVLHIIPCRIPCLKPYNMASYERKISMVSLSGSNCRFEIV